MVQWVAVHIPHLVPPLIAFFFLGRMAVWAAAQPPSHYDDAQVEEWNRSRAEERARLNRPVRPRTATLGLIALGPLVLSFLTGLAIYTLSLRRDPSPEWLIWSHTVLGLVGLGLASAKSVELGWRTIVDRIQARRPQDAIASVTMLALGLPIVLTGIVMLFGPSGRGFNLIDYVHIIVGVWWVLILQWHLYRYLARALKARSGTAASDAAS